jgi:hypothetical protein
VRRGGYEYDG